MATIVLCLANDKYILTFLTKRSISYIVLVFSLFLFLKMFKTTFHFTDCFSSNQSQVCCLLSSVYIVAIYVNRK